MKQFRQNGLNPGEYLFKVKSRNRWEESEWSTPLYVYLEEPDPSSGGWEPPDPWYVDSGDLGGTAPPAPTPTWSGNIMSVGPTGYLIHEGYNSGSSGTKTRYVSNKVVREAASAGRVDMLAIEWSASGGFVYHYYKKQDTGWTTSSWLRCFPYWDITDTEATRYRYTGGENQPETYTFSTSRITPLTPQRQIAAIDISNTPGSLWTPRGSTETNIEMWNFGVRFNVVSGQRRWGNTTDYTNSTFATLNTSTSNFYNGAKVLYIISDMGGALTGTGAFSQSGSITIGSWTPVGRQVYKVQ